MFYIYILLILSLGQFFASSQLSVNRVLYDQSGEYVLKPEDYNYSDNIFISISGAGSGSTHYSQNDITWYCPGNSGSYVSFNLITYNRTFTFTLGTGGYSILGLIIYQPYSNQNESSVNGNYSSFTITDSKGDQIMLIVPGGNANGTSSRPTFYDEIKFDEIQNLGLADFISSEGVVFDCYAWNNIPNGGYGAYSKFGYEGGNLNSTPKCDGYLGSGSGYNCCYCMVDEHNVCIRPYKGGDGALLIYF